MIDVADGGVEVACLTELLPFASSYPPGVAGAPTILLITGNRCPAKLASMLLALNNLLMYSTSYAECGPHCVFM